MSKGFLGTPIGTLEITAENGKILRIELAQRKEHEDKLPTECVETCQNASNIEAIDNAKFQLTEYFAGRRKTFDMEIELHGTEFQKKVWQVLLAIPYGQTLSYAQVAEASGNPKAQRAAGSAVGKNPLLIVVPCHRVIRSDGSLGGFSAGIENKVILQRIEGIEEEKLWSI